MDDRTSKKKEMVSIHNSLVRVMYSMKVHITFHTTDNHTSRIAIPKMTLHKHDAHHDILALG
jgi:hypothetical protein